MAVGQERINHRDSNNWKLEEVAIEMNNRWRKREKAKGAEPGMSMRAIYTQVENALDTYLRYSEVL